MKGVPACSSGALEKRPTPWALRTWPMIVILGVLSCAGNASAQSHGPFTTSEQNPLYRSLGTYPAERADVVESQRVAFAISYSNLFELGADAGYNQLFDLEQMVNMLELRLPLRDDVEIGGAVSLVSSWGGFLDGFITDFHEFFGFPNAGRELRPSNEHTLMLQVDPDAAPGGQDVNVDLGRRTLEVEDVRAHVKWRISGGRYRRGTLSLQGTVRALAGPFDRGTIDVAGAVLGRYSSGPFHFHGQLGASTLRAPSELASISKEAAIFYAGAVEAALTPGFSVIAQLGGSSDYVDDLGTGPLEDIPLNLVVGFAGGSDGGWAWEASFAEDVLARGPSVDFTVDVELSHPIGVLD